jgi:uncharacterized membrane protein
MSLGPIQILIIGFEKDDFAHNMLPELRVLDEKGFIKIVDILFVKKDGKGSIFAFCEDELTGEEAIRFGSIAGTLIGLGVPEDENDRESIGPGNFGLAENDFGSNLKEIAGIIEKIPNDSPFAVVLIEQCWTIELNENITKSGGVLLAQGQVSPKSLINIGAEIDALKRYHG